MNNTDTTAQHLLLIDLPLGPDQPFGVDNSILDLVTSLISSLLLTCNFTVFLEMVDLVSLRIDQHTLAIIQCCNYIAFHVFGEFLLFLLSLHFLIFSPQDCRNTTFFFNLLILLIIILKATNRVM